MAKNRNLFISHAWTYTDHYEKLCGFLDAAPAFTYSNYSVPKDDPVHNAPTNPALRAAIKRQMSSCHVVLILAGVYASYSEWIQREIEIAKVDFNKPILAIEPWGAERTSAVVKKAADETVKWNTKSIVGGIRKLYP